MKREIKEIIGSLGKGAVDVSSTIIKNAKTHIKLSSENEKLNKAYTDIGRKVHEIYSYGGKLGEYFDDKYKEIQTIEKNIAEIKLKMEEKNNNVSNNWENENNQNINTQKVYKICPICQEKNDENSTFCLKCGRSM